MIVETLSTGDEIVLGQVVDTNSAHIMAFLMENGLPVKRHGAVGDDRKALTAMFTEISTRADICLVTGGLGPTTDDLTAEAIAEAAGVPLVLNEEALLSMKSFFMKRGFNPSVSDNKQAMLPQGSLCLPNPVGTAPGFAVRVGRCLFYFMPGVPHEMKAMLINPVWPSILKLTADKRKSHVNRVLSVFGLPEAALSEHLKDFHSRFSDIRLGFRAVFPTLEVKLHGEGDDKEVLDRSMAAAILWIQEKLGDFIFSTEGGALEEALGKLLKERRETLAVAESCTGGLVSHLITNVSGSSDYFLLSAVTYSNQAKMSLLSVSQKTLETFGAVSEETVKEMADGVRLRAGATYGIAISGIAGPTGGSEEKPVGTVCIGLSTSLETIARQYRFTFNDRSMNKRIFTAIALETLRKKLLSIYNNRSANHFVVSIKNSC